MKMTTPKRQPKKQNKGTKALPKRGGRAATNKSKRGY
tara:strand:+ start:410 stop:520 length:111 start_codon:yes stop_codon:yes gene_type:complete